MRFLYQKAARSVRQQEWREAAGAQREAARATRSSGRAARGGKSGAKRNATMWGWGCIKRREMGCKELPRCLDKMRREAGDSKSNPKDEAARAARSSGAQRETAKAARSSSAQRETARAARSSSAQWEEAEKQARGIIFLDF